MNTYNINFYCRSSKANKKGLAPVEISVLINGERSFIQLPRKEYPEVFKKSLESKRQNPVKEYLDEVRVQFNKIQLDMMRNGIPLTANNLKDYFRTGGVKPYTINDLFTEFLALNKKRVGVDLTEAAYQKYEYVRNLFYQKVNPESELTTLSCSIIDDFYVYLQSRYNTATSASHMTRLKTVLKFGMDDGRITFNPFKNVKVKHYKKKIVYLTEEELDKVYNADITNKSLSDVRDAFIVQSYTGLAYIDLYNLKKEDIQVDEEGNHFITKSRQKTGSEFTTVVLDRGVEILKKHNYQLHILTNQKYNEYLKQIAVIAGIEKTLTTHVARKTFCCMLLNRGVSINTVAKAAGHQDIKVTRSYYTTLQESTVIREIKAAF